MIKSYLKIAFRSLIRNKSYTFINILGLVIGISFSCMLYIYVSHELSYDSFHRKSDRIYRAITIDNRVPDNPRSYGVAVPPLGKALVDTYPDVEDMVRLHRFTGQVVFEMNGQNFQERNWFTTDPNFFQVFDFEFVSGDKATALKDPYSLVVTQSAAKRYFGDEDPVGKMIEKTSFGAIKVTGVIKDPPNNSHLQFDMLFSAVAPEKKWSKYLNSWDDYGAFTYIVIKEGASIEAVKMRLPELQKRHSATANSISFDLQSIRDIYLGSESIEEGTESVHGQRTYIYIFSSMGIFLLIIACINYINLTTSKALARSREVGVRKVVGAYKNQLFIQFMTESFTVTVFSMIIAIGVMDMVFPYFNQITGKEFDVNPQTLREYFPPLIVISLIVATISGSYPALYLARLKPISSLKGIEGGEKNAITLRKSLVVFQFTLTIVMIISTIVIGSQLNFIQTKDIGFEKDRLMVIDINSGNVRKQFKTVKTEYLNIPGVEAVAVATRIPGEWKNINELYISSSSANDGTTDSVKTYYMGFDEDMLDTYKLTLLEGRNFSNNGKADSTSILLNQSAVRSFGLNNPLGSVIKMKTGNGILNATVIGVIKDFNFQSLHQKIAPIIIGAYNNPVAYIDYFTLKISGDVEKAIQSITNVHNKFDTRTPIEYHFLDQQLESFYVAEKRVAMIFKMGGALSILVACLGLFGLATYNIERRTKELGIRKVLGASEMNLFIMLSSTFTRQVGIAYLIAAPAAYFLMSQWLEIFEYKISLHAGIFLLAGLIALVIALATVSYRSIKAAHASPVNSLRQQ